MESSNVFSVDVEEWFHILDSDQTPSEDDWDSQEERVRQNTGSMLKLLEDRSSRATFFVLGWVAERYPELVREIADRGHEIASHGHRHRLVYEQSPDEFRDELRRAQDAIHDACGAVPKGFRAPGFSIRSDTLWALDVLVEEGFIYDSSIFPARRAHGGIPGAGTEPWRHENGLYEFPISTAGVGGLRVAYIGGGYLRFFPKWLISKIANGQISQGKPLILYVHPRDIDAGQPRLKLKPWRMLKTYIGLGGCEAKLDSLLGELDWGAFEDVIPA